MAQMRWEQPLSMMKRREDCPPTSSERHSADEQQHRMDRGDGKDEEEGFDVREGGRHRNGKRIGRRRRGRSIRRKGEQYEEESG